MKILFFYVLIIIAAFHSAFASGNAARTIAVTAAIPFFEKPHKGLFPRGFLERGDTCVIDTLFADTAGSIWIAVGTSNGPVWITSEGVRFVADTTDNMPPSRTFDDERDRKRRYKVLRDNPGWSRRIVRAIRDGRICLGMNRDHVQASWGEPFQTGDSFILGIGRHEAWFYRSGEDSVLPVYFLDGIVIGWYTGNK